MDHHLPQNASYNLGMLDFRPVSHHPSYYTSSSLADAFPEGFLPRPLSTRYIDKDPRYPIANHTEVQPIARSNRTRQEIPPLNISDGVKSKRHQVRNACSNCQKSCKRCADIRPCPRCVNKGMGDTCVDSVRKERERGKKRGPYKRRAVPVDLNGAAFVVNPQPAGFSPYYISTEAKYRVERSQDAPLLDHEWRYPSHSMEEDHSRGSSCIPSSPISSPKGRRTATVDPTEVPPVLPTSLARTEPFYPSDSGLRYPPAHYDPQFAPYNSILSPPSPAIVQPTSPYYSMQMDYAQRKFTPTSPSGPVKREPTSPVQSAQRARPTSPKSFCSSKTSDHTMSRCSQYGTDPTYRQRRSTTDVSQPDSFPSYSHQSSTTRAAYHRHTRPGRPYVGLYDVDPLASYPQTTEATNLYVCPNGYSVAQPE